MSTKTRAARHRRYEPVAKKLNRKMPYCFEYDTRSRILRCQGQGGISDAEMREAYEHLFRYFEDFKPAAFIMDTSRITSFDVRSETMRYLAGCSPPGSRGIPRFIVAPAAFMYGMARMFQIYAEDNLPDLRVVRHLEDVLEELGASDVHFEPVSQGSVTQH